MRRIHLVSRSGLSTVVVSMIMLSAVTLMGSGIVSWSNTNLFSHQKDLQNTFSINVNKINEDLVIENVWFGKTPQKFLNVTLSNIGNISVNVTKIQLVNSTHNITYEFNDVEIVPQKSGSKIINNQWGNNQPVDILVTTERGSIFRTQASPP